MLLEGKVALITGAGRGIGRAVAQAFASQGARVLAGDINLDWVEETAERINTEHPASVLSCQLDITDSQDVQNAVDRCMQKFGRLDILVNNAGVHRSHPFLAFPLEAFDWVYRVNVMGTLICSQTAARLMGKQGDGGCIINFSSASGKKADPGGTAYNTSKSAIIGLTRVMALELGPYGIRANCILPGATDTEMLADVFTAEPDLRKVLEERTPLGRMAAPQDQANAAVFLASDLAAHITGEQLVVSGGEFMET